MPLPNLKGPGKVNLTVVPGARFDQGFAVTVDGVRQPLAGYRVAAQIRITHDGPLVIDLTPFLAVDTVNNVINLNIPASRSAQILRGGVWDMFVINETNPDDAEQIVEGKVTLGNRVTR